MAKNVAGDLYVDIDGQLMEIKRQLRQKEGYPYDPMRLVEHLQAAIEGNLVNRYGQPFESDVYPIVVDYGKSVEEMVGLGRYDWSNSDIASKNFPTKCTGKTGITVELIHFNQVISSDEAIKKLDKMGFRPAELHELLAFGEKYPEIQREFSIIALGSVWQDPYGDRGVPYLDRGGSGRHLNLRWIVRDWHGLCRFAAVRK